MLLKRHSIFAASVGNEGQASLATAVYGKDPDDDDDD